MMFQRWGRAIANLSRVGLQYNLKFETDFNVVSRRSYAKVAAAAADSVEKDLQSEPKINLDRMFWSKPCSLALAPDSSLRVEEPNYEGVKRIIFKLMLFYSKQSKSIRGANVVYRRIVSQVDKPLIYEVFNLEKTFKTTFALLVLHMWLCLRRLKEEGKEGVEFGQYLYEIYNHDVELRVSKAGVNLLLTRWMKDLEKIFYGNIVAYDSAMLPEAKSDEMSKVIWRNIYSDDGSSQPNDAASRTVQACYDFDFHYLGWQSHKMCNLGPLCQLAVTQDVKSWSIVPLWLSIDAKSNIDSSYSCTCHSIHKKKMCDSPSLTWVKVF